MGISLELKRSSKQQSNSKPVQERVLLHPVNQISKHQARWSKVKNHVDPPRNKNNLHSVLKRDMAKSPGNQHEQSNKGNAVGDSELVKHMTNLPCYLQRAEKGEIFQDRVLNVGVLDWTRLEQWKYKQKIVSEKVSTNASRSNSYSLLKRGIETPRSSSLVHAGRRSDHHSSLRSSAVSFRKDDLSHGVEGSVRNLTHFQDPKAPSKSTISGQKNVSQGFKYFGRSHSTFNVEKEKIKDVDPKGTPEMERVSGKFRSFGASLGPKVSSSSWIGKTKATEVSQQTDTTRVNIDRNIISEVHSTSSKIRGSDIQLNSKGKKGAERIGTKIRGHDSRQPDIDLQNQSYPEKGNSIVLRLPKELVKRPTSRDKNATESSQNGFSECLSTKEINSVKIFSDIPHSCPLTSADEANFIPHTIPNVVTGDRSRELSSVESRTFPCSAQTQDLYSEGRYESKNKSDAEPLNSSVTEPIDVLDEEAIEMPVSKSRNPSSRRRFSFSLSSVGRSFSFKEGSTVPQSSSSHVTINSGPVSSNASDSVDSPNKGKAKGHNRTRSSPFRRLLDPILKHKEGNSLENSESGLWSKGSFNSFSSSKGSFNSFSSGLVYSFPYENLEESQVQALLQLKANKGVPLFKFVVNNSSNILAATMKNLTLSDKDYSHGNYTFYLVNEIKKKSGGWMSQASKVKSCRYVYNVIGQMKVPSTDFTGMSHIRGQDSDQYMVKESVLFGVERKQPDQRSPNIMLNRELAAAVVKMPTKQLIRHEHHTDEESMEDRCFYGFGEDGYLNGVTVILPGGVHSVPAKGEPSPLIDRWRSGGGSCDCGGWDVGCKLRVLINKNRCSQGSKTKEGRILNSFELYPQGVSQDNRPIFSLVASKDGMYSVEYNTSISPLQAFFICVVILNSQKPPHLTLESNVSEAKAFDQPDMSANNGCHQVKFPEKYAPNPPLSPVGRV